MRRKFNPQLQLGATPIEHIRFNPKSRDDIPQILRGLQHIWTTQEVRDEVLGLLETAISEEIDFGNGRPGMDLWVLLVLGCLRTGLNCDFDRLHELANEHKTVRAMLGHGAWADDWEYKLQTLKDNVELLKPEVLEKINIVVVNSGHDLLKKKDEPIQGRCDSFVVEMNVEYPTDIGLLWDAVRKVMQLTSRLCREHHISGWRQVEFGLKRLKSCFRKSQLSKRSRKAGAEEEVKKAHKRYIKKAREYLDKSFNSMGQLEEKSINFTPEAYSRLQERMACIASFQEHAERQIDQINRRVLQGETIEASEKVYSVFNPEVEWVVKGKAGTPFELGIKVCVIEDQHQFIIHHRVMQSEEDADIAVDVVKNVQKDFPNLHACSFDRGFYSGKNKTDLGKILENVTLPKKGKLSAADIEIQSTQEFKQARRQHSAIESAINALEQNGLDRCPDRGIQKFKCYVGLAILTRNIKRMGCIITQEEREKIRLEAKLAA